MPTYAYACKSCGHAFDAVQAFSDPSLTNCPACGGSLRKVYGSIGVTFNGSGFYRTDSRGSSGASATGSGAASGDSTASAPSSDSGAKAPAPASS
ncbi:FmdB family zinc ribbon protein [Microbacterium halotolerans]|uniref:FmdB family zinc ribbon protein n=1 Tax=Microbacterium halotolerans TaxID=246613 RepID=UPI000E6AAA3D|nr:FmdB family zinc ribbon protein [Microbacterium halotolerans]